MQRKITSPKVRIHTILWNNKEIHQVIFNMIVTKYFFRKVHTYIEPWGEELATVVWSIKEYYHHTLGFPTGQAVFGQDIPFNLTPIVDWCVVTARKHQKPTLTMFAKTTGNSGMTTQ